MLRNEVGRQTKRVVICPHCVAIDLLLYAAGFLEGTASTEEKKKKEVKKKGEKKRKGELREGGGGEAVACSIIRSAARAEPPRRLLGLNK